MKALIMCASLLHAFAALIWIVLVIPTVLWWRDSILWLGFMSIWANVVSHATAYEAARAKELTAQAPPPAPDPPA